MYTPDGMFDSIPLRPDAGYFRNVYPLRRRGVDDPALDLIERS